jgi:hypothetical protein
MVVGVGIKIRAPATNSTSFIHPIACLFTNRATLVHNSKFWKTLTSTVLQILPCGDVRRNYKLIIITFNDSLLCIYNNTDYNYAITCPDITSTFHEADNIHSFLLFLIMKLGQEVICLSLKNSWLSTYGKYFTQCVAMFTIYLHTKLYMFKLQYFLSNHQQMQS